MPDIKGPFEVCETYEHTFQIIDSTTRSVLDDVYAYDDNDQAREMRMANIARALSICYGTKPDPDMARTRQLLADAIDIATRLATDSHAPREKLLARVNAIHAEANIKRHWQDCAANHGGDCDMGTECGSERQ